MGSEPNYDTIITTFISFILLFKDSLKSCISTHPRFYYVVASVSFIFSKLHKIPWCDMVLFKFRFMSTNITLAAFLDAISFLASLNRNKSHHSTQHLRNHVQVSYKFSWFHAKKQVQNKIHENENRGKMCNH